MFLFVTLMVCMAVAKSQELGGIIGNGSIFFSGISGISKAFGRERGGGREGFSDNGASRIRTVARSGNR